MLDLMTPGGAGVLPQKDNTKKCANADGRRTTKKNKYKYKLFQLVGINSGSGGTIQQQPFNCAMAHPGAAQNVPWHTYKEKQPFCPEERYQIYYAAILMVFGGGSSHGIGCRETGSIIAKP